MLQELRTFNLITEFTNIIMGVAGVTGVTVRHMASYTDVGVQSCIHLTESNRYISDMQGDSAKWKLAGRKGLSENFSTSSPTFLMENPLKHNFWRAIDLHIFLAGPIFRALCITNI